MADYSDESSLRRFAAFTPDERAQIQAYESDPARLSELDDEIARTTDPARRRVLEEYRESTFGPSAKPAVGGLADAVRTRTGGRPGGGTTLADRVRQRLEQADDAPEQQPAQRSTLRAAGDLALGFAGGAVGTTKAAVDAFGAENPVSQALGDAGKFIESGLSDQAQASSRRQQEVLEEAKRKGVW